MRTSLDRKILMSLLWILTLANAGVSAFVDAQIVSAILWLLYGFGVTLLHVIERKAKISKDTRELLKFGFALGTILPIFDLVIKLIEYIRA